MIYKQREVWVDNVVEINNLINRNGHNKDMINS